MGGLSDLLKGKEKKIGADPLAKTINQSGKFGLKNLMLRGAQDLDNKFFSNPEASVQNQIGLENKLMRGAVDDSMRKAGSAIASRGMQNSSLGLGQLVNAQQGLRDKIALNNASGMERTKDLIKEKMQVGANLFGAKTAQGPIQMQQVKYRTGGLGGLIGAGIGAYAGGPAGAQVGMQAGNMYANS